MLIMFNKLTNKNLGIVFAVLLILFAVLMLWDGQKGERTFRDTLVDIDTADVTQILLYPKSQDHKEVRLFNEDGQWKVQLDSERTALVPHSKISNLYTQLMAIVPKRLAARGQDKWTEFQVDSTATRVKVVEGGDTTLDLIIGRFSYQQQPRSMSTFVRLGNDIDIYEVDGFLEMTFNQSANSFRDGSILKGDNTKWNQLSFDYPADSSFQMIKVNNGWTANFTNADSAKTERYFRQITNMTSTEFFDDIDEAQLPAPSYKLTIQNTDGNEFEINGYEIGDRFVIHSSTNPEAYFDGNKNKFKNKIFIGLNSVLP